MAHRTSNIEQARLALVGAQMGSQKQISELGTLMAGNQMVTPKSRGATAGYADTRLTIPVLMTDKKEEPVTMADRSTLVKFYVLTAAGMQRGASDDSVVRLVVGMMLAMYPIPETVEFPPSMQRVPVDLVLLRRFGAAIEEEALNIWNDVEARGRSVGWSDKHLKDAANYAAETMSEVGNVFWPAVRAFQLAMGTPLITPKDHLCAVSQLDDLTLDPYAYGGVAGLFIYGIAKRIDAANMAAHLKNRPKNIRYKYKLGAGEDEEDDEGDYILGGPLVPSYIFHEAVNPAFVKNDSARVFIIKFAATIPSEDQAKSVAAFDTIVRLVAYSGISSYTICYNYMMAHQEIFSFADTRGELLYFFASMKRLNMEPAYIQPFFKLMYGDSVRIFQRSSLTHLINIAVATQKDSVPTLDQFKHDEDDPSIARFVHFSKSIMDDAEDDDETTAGPEDAFQAQ